MPLQEQIRIVLFVLTPLKAEAKTSFLERVPIHLNSFLTDQIVNLQRGIAAMHSPHSLAQYSN